MDPMRNRPTGPHMGDPITIPAVTPKSDGSPETRLRRRTGSAVAVITTRAAITAATGGDYSTTAIYASSC